MSVDEVGGHACGCGDSGHRDRGVGFAGCAQGSFDGPSGARWLADRQVRAVGADTIALEQITSSAGLSQLPVHRILLREEGINLIELMNLEELSGAGVAEFLFI